MPAVALALALGITYGRSPVGPGSGGIPAGALYIDGQPLYIDGEPLTID